jgi:hypothetical protein
MKRTNGWLVWTAAAALGLASATATARAQETSQPAQQQAPDAQAVVTRTYNVADLVRTAPDYPFDSAVIPPTVDPDKRPIAVAPGQVGQRGLLRIGDNEKPASPKPGIALDQLLTVIQRTVAPESWRPAPPPGLAVDLNVPKEMIGTIQPLGSLLIVTQTPDNQKRIQELLDAIRKEYGPLKTVGVSARWVLLDPGQAQQLTAGQAGAVAVVDPAQLQKLPPDAIWAVGRTACFSGQTVSLASGRGRTWVYDMQPVVGTNAAAYDPEVQLVQSGAVLQVTPLLSPKGDSAVLDLASVATDWAPMDKPFHVPAAAVGTDTNTPTTHPAVDVPAFVDRLNVGVQQMRTTIRIPVGKPVLVGGMTRDPGTDTRELYLIAEVTAGE